MLVHQLYNMEMVEYVNSTRTVFKDRSNESSRQISCYMFYLNLMPFDPFPKLFESVNSLAITHIDYPARVKINDNCFVYMTFSDSKLINTYVLDSFQGGRTIVPQ